MTSAKSKRGMRSQEHRGPTATASLARLAGGLPARHERRQRPADEIVHRSRLVRRGLDQSSAHRALYDAKVTSELLRQLLTGAYQQQKVALDSAMANSAESGARLSASLGDACAGLAALKQQLLAQGAAA